MIMSQAEHERLNALLDELNAIRHWARATSTTANECFNTIAELDPIEIKNLILFGIAELDARNQGDILDHIQSELRKRL